MPNNKIYTAQEKTEEIFKMKKRILATVAAIMLAATTAISAAYPASPEWDFELPKDGKILTGELFGHDSWSSNADVAFDKAWDGDTDTFYDPAGVGEDLGATGVKLDQAYILTEIRIMPRSSFLDRFNGATIQGSNDGETWTDIFISVAVAESPDYICILPADFEDGANTGYSYYRYVNNTIHGDVAEVELYGNPVGGAAVAETPAPAETEAPAVETAAPEAETVEVAPAETVAAPTTTTTTAPATNDSFALIASILALTIVSTYVVMRKKIAR